MSMFIQITLTQLGNEAGPFDIYSDVDSYTTPFDTNVSAASMSSGYSTLAPNGTTNVKVKSEGGCINYVILPVQNLP